MSNICTNLKQSSKLIELGINKNTADMTWQVVRRNKLLHIGYQSDKYTNVEVIIPAWSLSALLELIPIITKNLHHPPSLTKAIDGSGYFIEYPCYPNLPIYVDKNPINVAYKAIVWLIENGYIKKISNDYEQLRIQSRKE